MINIDYANNNESNSLTNFIVTNYGQVENIYSVGIGDLKKNPNVYQNRLEVNNSYYFAEKIVPSEVDQLATKLALRGTNFQNQMLNNEEAFNVNELIGYGFYPHLNMNSCMPHQDYIELPEVQDEDLPDILSSEVIEEGTNTARVRLTIHNPSGEKISRLEITDIENEIISDNYADGQSEVIIELKNPTMYLSQYSIMSLTTESALGIEYTRSYEEGERVINVDLYREVSTVEDWRTINDSPTENYKLVNDIDFINYNTGININDFRGKLNGDNHTIKNIDFKNNECLIEALKGEVKNLRIENYKQVNSKGNYIGIIKWVYQESIIDNVHVKDIEILSKNESDTETTIGGLISKGDSYNITIRNCSVTNFKVNQTEELSGIILGGIVGELPTISQVENCYAQNIDFDILNVGRYRGIGGIVGRTNNNQVSIKNCYTTGNINTSGEYVGGIVGSNLGSINNCYSLVNINSASEYIGGIVGTDTSTANNEAAHLVSNNISIGNVYSRTVNSQYVNRIFGSTNNTMKSNYAYKEQLINGQVVDEEQGATLLTREQLLQRNTYINVGFGDSYDYSDLSYGILPKLYNTNGKELLPNQEDNKLEEKADIRIDSIEANKKDVNHAEIRIVINNPQEERITNVEIDSMDVTIERNITQEGKTYIDIVATANKYYDSYKITAIVYEENGEVKKTEEERKIELQFFKDIGKIEDWQGIDSYSAQNYRLVADLDFSSVREPNTNVSIGRLVAEGNGYTIRNLTTTDKNLIKEAKLEIRNITFENINITNNNSYVGIIGTNNAILEDLSFRDCNIQSGGSYIAIIPSNSSKNIKGITLENINCSGGSSYIGGFIGNTEDGEFSDIKGNDITINATGNYVGGIFGLLRVTDAAKDIEVTDIEVDNSEVITSGNTVGGIAGRARVMNTKVTNTYVKGNTNVGGTIGENIDGSNWIIQDGNNISKNVKVEGVNSVGGVFGRSGTNWINVFTIDSQIIASGDNVGGLVGYAGCYIYNSGVINTKIQGRNRVGGLAGYGNSYLYDYDFVVDTEVEGYDQVGGLAGYTSQQSRYIYLYSNASVTAINGSAGGIIGYYNNISTSQAKNIYRFNQIMLQGSEISGTEYVGGLIGKLDKEFVFSEQYSTEYYGYYIDANLNNSSSEEVSLGFGNFDSQTDDLDRLFTYKYSSINGQYVENVKDLEENQVVTGEQLKEQKTYTDRGFTTTYFDFSILAQNKYPILVGVENQEGIDLPQDPEGSGISLFSNELPKEVEENTSSDNEDLPDITAYAVDVDKINIDFSEVVDGTYFNYTVNGQKSESITLENKTYTFEFDFQTPIEIELVNGENRKTVEINPDDIRRKSSYVGDSWMYLDGNTIVLNGNSTSGEYVNLYNGKGLTTEGKVIDIVSGKEESSISGISLVDTKAISEYSYNGTEIRTFGTYSLVGDKVRNQIYEVKDGKLSVISSNVQRKIGDNIIDFYNENEYQTILGSDGILYDLKETLKYPSNFENSNISEISVESDKKEVLVYYKNGSIIIFNYMTGEEIYKTSPKEKVSLFAYIGEKLSKPDELYTDLHDEYEQSKELEEKLVEEPIELYLGLEDTNNNNSSKLENNNSNESYVTVYNAESDKYEVYKESELLDESVDEPESETSKIEKVQGLQDYYYSGSKTIEKDNGLVYIGISIIALGISIGILHKLVIVKGKKEKNKDK